MVTTTNYTGPNYGPKEGMAYTAVMPQEGFQYTYDQDGRRFQIPIGKFPTPPGGDVIGSPGFRIVSGPLDILISPVYYIFYTIFFLVYFLIFYVLVVVS